MRYQGINKGRCKGNGEAQFYTFEMSFAQGFYTKLDGSNSDQTPLSKKMTWFLELYMGVTSNFLNNMQLSQSMQRLLGG